MMFYAVMLTMSTLSIAVILGLGLSNGGQGGAPYWPVVVLGVGLLVCKLATIKAIVSSQR